MNEYIQGRKVDRGLKDKRRNNEKKKEGVFKNNT